MSKTSPFFSVVIPALNEHIALPKTLESLKNQTFTNFEVIIIDGGSTDKTQEKAQKYAPVFKERGGFLFKVSPNKKTIGAQRNVGAKLTRGTYLVFFDADVMVGATFLEEIHAFIQRSGAELITTWSTPDSPDMLNRVLSTIMNWSIILVRNTKKPLLVGFNIMIKKSAFEKIGGFDDTIILGEDHALAQAAKKHGITVSFLHKPVLTYSLRRFKSEGRLTVIKKYIRSTLYIWFKGPIRHSIYEYKMGGAAHEK